MLTNVNISMFLLSFAKVSDRWPSVRPPKVPLHAHPGRLGRHAPVADVEQLLGEAGKQAHAFGNIGVRRLDVDLRRLQDLYTPLGPLGVRGVVHGHHYPQRLLMVVREELDEDVLDQPKHPFVRVADTRRELRKRREERNGGQLVDKRCDILVELRKSLRPLALRPPAVVEPDGQHPREGLELVFAAGAEAQPVVLDDLRVAVLLDRFPLGVLVHDQHAIVVLCPSAR